MTGIEQRFPGFEIESVNANMTARRARLLDFDMSAIAPSVFLDHDGVGAFRHHATGEDARCFARLKLPRERPAGGDLANDL